MENSVKWIAAMVVTLLLYTTWSLMAALLPQTAHLYQPLSALIIFSTHTLWNHDRGHVSRSPGYGTVDVTVKVGGALNMINKLDQALKVEVVGRGVSVPSGAPASTGGLAV